MADKPEQQAAPAPAPSPTPAPPVHVDPDSHVPALRGGGQRGTRFEKGNKRR